jgi:hypothetical protein
MRSDRTRSLASIVLAALAGLLIVTGAIAAYASTQVIDHDAFADRAVAALDRDAVRHVVARELVTALVDQGSTDLVAARPLLESVVDGVLRTDPFRRVLRRAALEANRVFFSRDGSRLTLNVSDAAAVVRFAAQSVSPKLAREIPSKLQSSLLSIQRREFAATTLSLADHLRALGLILPLCALLSLLGAIAIAPDRRTGVLRCGIAVGAAGVLLAGALLILRARMLTGVFGEDELTDADVRGAVGGLLSAYFGDLLTWALALGIVGLVIAAAAAALDPEHVEAPATRLGRALLRRPKPPWQRALRAVAAIAAGIFVALSPIVALQIVALLLGAYLVFLGVGELLVLLQRPGPVARARRGRRRALVTAAAAGGLAVAAVLAAVLVATSGDGARPSLAATTSAGTCNGSAALCGQRLNQAVFAGTHNSFSAADSPGWAIANQRRTITRQLQDGIRLFLLDPHWGVGAGRRVRTDFHREGRSRNRVAKALPQATLAAAQRLAGQVGAGGSGGGTSDVYLCHTVCELGATRMVDALGDIRSYLDSHRGEVVILFIEPYVAPADIARTFHAAGLDRYVATLQRDKPLPTLGELVRANRRVVVLTEKDADGTVPWYLDGFSFVQDTPLGATKLSQLSCRANRGTADSPLLMLNHWADTFPPSVRANVPFQREQAILDRAHRCARERGLPVNLIAVDHYDRGGLIAAVKQLNDEQLRAVRREGAAP